MRVLAVGTAIRVLRAAWPIVRAAVLAQEDAARPGSEKLRAAVAESLPLVAAVLRERWGLRVDVDVLGRLLGGVVELVLVVRELRSARS